jgi:hypothetical protein
MALNSKNPNMFYIIYFTWNTSVKVRATVTIDGTTIHRSPEAKYLGDQKLKFLSHISQIVAKGIKYALAIVSIIKSKLGPEFNHLRRLFIAVAAPRIEYAAIIWHRPGETRTAPTTSQLNSQVRIMRAITGCFRTTIITSLEHETALLSS